MAKPNISCKVLCSLHSSGLVNAVKDKIMATNATVSSTRGALGRVKHDQQELLAEALSRHSSTRSALVSDSTTLRARVVETSSFSQLSFAVLGTESCPSANCVAARCLC